MPGTFSGDIPLLKSFRSGHLSHDYLNTKVNSVIYYMNENITERLTIQDFATYIGYSESYFIEFSSVKPVMRQSNISIDSKSTGPAIICSTAP